MLKKIITFTVSFNAFSSALISNIKTGDSINKINFYYGDAVKKVNDVRSKIDTVLGILSEIANGIDKYRDALKNCNDSTNYEYYDSQKNYIIYKNEVHSDEFKLCSSSTEVAKSCIYKFHGEEIFLNPYYITNVCATCYYVITSWAGYSWDTMYSWFKNRSATQYGLAKNYEDKKFYIADLNEDKSSVELLGSISIDKPNASIYMNIELKSSEKSNPLIHETQYMFNHVGWAAFDSYLLLGKMRYRITDQSKEKLQNLKQRMIVLKFEIDSAISKLKAYNSESDYNNDRYENSNLKQILDECEQAYNNVTELISLGKDNGWIQKF